MNERIKELRLVLNMTQESFAQRLGVKRNTIGNYETGNRIPSNQIIFSICREFNVNEDWLRDGNGEMFIELSKDQELARLVGSILPTAPDYIKNTFINLGHLAKKFKPEDWKVIEEFVSAISGK